MSSLVDKLIPRNEHSPHKVIITMSAQIYEMLNTGECGRISEKILPFTVSIDGDNKNNAIKKINEFFEEIKNRCKNG